MPLSAIPKSSLPPVSERGRMVAATTPLHADVRACLAQRPALPHPGAGATLARWRALAHIAAGDLCVVKVMEAHYDALAILDELDAASPPADRLLAVWAAEPPDARVQFVAQDGAEGRLDGVKAWCSGADLVDAALVTAYQDNERVLVLVELRQPGVARLRSGWHAVGMGRVHSGRVAFDDARASRVGAPGAYLARPGFWHGGAGIAACWFGAAAAIAERLRTHPRIGSDAHAAAHLGAVDIALSAAAAVLRETAALIDTAPAAPHTAAVIRARSLLERVATEVVDRVGRALGPGPLCEDFDHARRCADLTTFIRQSHAERDWTALGEAVARQEAAWTL
ncbi:acyl-CoA dehydrogenase [Luteimonas sp. TWI1416]|uniref:acyl-CoA dehydrogenase n=1 Tax=unclassified Luteimonas TaxID=2629088 RepID=UPI003208CAAF